MSSLWDGWVLLPRANPIQSMGTTSGTAFTLTARAGAQSTHRMPSCLQLITLMYRCRYGLQVVRERYLRDDIWCVKAGGPPAGLSATRPCQKHLILSSYRTRASLGAHATVPYQDLGSPSRCPQCRPQWAPPCRPQCCSRQRAAPCAPPPQPAPPPSNPRSPAGLPSLASLSARPIGIRSCDSYPLPFLSPCLSPPGAAPPWTRSATPPPTGCQPAPPTTCS